MEPLILHDWLACPAGRGQGCCPAIPPAAFAWADPQFAIFQVSSLKEEANDFSHPSVSDKENICSFKNISGSFTAPPLTPAKESTEKKHKISL